MASCRSGADDVEGGKCPQTWGSRNFCAEDVQSKHHPWAHLNSPGVSSRLLEVLACLENGFCGTGNGSDKHAHVRIGPIEAYAVPAQAFRHLTTGSWRRSRLPVSLRQDRPLHLMASSVLVPPCSEPKEYS